MPSTMTRGGAAGGYGVDPKTGLPYSHRSKLVAGLLQIFLGGFGVGRFYTGHIGIAFAQIAVTLFTCGVGGLWPLIDGIIMLTSESPRDVDGKPLRPG
jgi:TM2 domain-containing membrane protein YozV